MSGMTCGCGSNVVAADCCEPYLSGTARPATAEALMRSRYVAFTREDADYLVATRKCDKPEQVRAEVAAAFEGVKWLGLRVLETRQGGVGDNRGWVTFVATYFAGGAIHELEERSQFRRIGGKWLYVGSAD